MVVPTLLSQMEPNEARLYNLGVYVIIESFSWAESEPISHTCVIITMITLTKLQVQLYMHDRWGILTVNVQISADLQCIFQFVLFF